MRKHIKNNDGVALVAVMMVLSVSMLVVFFMVNFLNSESRITNVNISRNRASQIAEAGVDLAINEWINYINNQHDPGNCPYGALSSIKINRHSPYLSITLHK
ncbi:hypothetical protein L7E55_15700 [Pelotomaculum isophthalicicum JI]|uniref:Type 4 fimbrial biogenesis protein PilX N-terminal domain-containing protein n=1 Tax=Pelotomaculum isophthalicicum JI TaxID=947010 RepID=A0A9X4JU33_9FIRM|nr:hypothetical protein [Pelotomaculum isophthalicicum]MDF9409774.1 hypothetical protein [Pelotomaculum isophthalicicum JI]